MLKKTVCLFVVSVFMFTNLQAPVFATSNNRVNKEITLQKNEKVTKKSEAAWLILDPLDVVSGGEIKLTLENAVWCLPWYSDEDYDRIMDSQGGLSDITLSQNPILEQLIIGPAKRIPWSLHMSDGDPKVAILTLMPLHNDYVKDLGKDAVYEIPLYVKATEPGDMNVVVDGSSSTISSGALKLGTCIEENAGTHVDISDIVTAHDKASLGAIAIGETSKNTIGHDGFGEKITLTLNGKYVFTQKLGTKLTLSADYDLPGNTEIYPIGGDKYIGTDTLSFYLPDQYKPSSKPNTLYIKGLQVEAADENNADGDIYMQVSGTNINQQTIQVASLSDYSFDYEAIGTAPILLSGRINEKPIYSATVHFAEKVPSSWLTERNLEFEVPEGVKIVDAAFDSDAYENVSKLQWNYSADRRKIIVTDVEVTPNRCGAFEMKLNLTADLDYEGDVPLKVSGGGLSSDTLDSIVIATVQKPFTIKTAEAELAPGYQSTAMDITLAENAPGGFVKNGEVTLNLDGLFSGENTGFLNNGAYIETDGDLEVDDFVIHDGVMSFHIAKSSVADAGAIHVRNVQVGANVDASYGSYRLDVGGSAIVNNYKEMDDIQQKGFGYYSDKTSALHADDYLLITDTPDKDEKKTAENAYAYTNDENTMVPLRFVLSALNNHADATTDIYWNSATKTATLLSGDGRFVQFRSGSHEMVVDGVVIPIADGRKIEIVNSTMFIPFGALAQLLKDAV